MIDGASYPDLAGMPVLITGGGSGIGASVALHFAAQGSKVAIVDLNAEALAKTRAEIQAETGMSIEAETVDLRDIAALNAAIESLAARTGAFRALINNAGDDTRHPLDKVTPDYWDDRFAVNLRHQFFAAQAVAPGMAAAGGGAVVNLGSISWMTGSPGMIAYTTAKSAIMGLTKSLARELGAMAIRVNSIAPGMIWTEKQIARVRAEDPAKFERYLERQCLKEHLEPADIARLALWLASNEARHCAGQTFVVDGGVV
ncbi:SDR family NAD(P)-dependent oxidoreductase [Bosea caraganae]|uniref:SDR family NAD(P)-dependent oxidoreductase n=1 Tax=Bosea caraganae TaxID=2763117 RepID=A0A370KXT3_9HYPH|nr:SDR family NAD(P)-dependent oxidoreductase [Bosea caraganae]RDJ19814.1 SDR family NAD(P)-dependent oxidoreductase [Bosea caraganae]RDJ30046.1 SDR family NAD(P)-dependent oxidoreductase [Bosea caraganae]